MIETRVIHTADDFREVQPLWARLARASNAATPFQNFGCNLLAMEMFAERERPYFVVAHSDSGTAIIPAVIREQEQKIAFAGETLFDYRDWLHEGSQDVLRIAWEELTKLDLPFELIALRGDVAAEKWEGLPIEFFCNAPMVERAQFDEEGFRAKHRRLGNRSRRIPRRGIELRRFTGEDSDIVRLIYEKKAEDPHVGALFADALRRDFMVKVCRMYARDCEIFTYMDSGDLVAALVFFRGTRARHFYTVFFDPRWAELSPGQMLLFEAAAQTLSEGLDCDFMTGEYPYKNRLATAQVPLYRVQASAEQLREYVEVHERWAEAA